jgi:membrane protein DedA with SNARE-associated domain
VASVFIGRFFGPVRAVIPLVAGIMDMTWRQFWLANIGSAIIWAPALLLFGTGLAQITRLMGAPRGWHITAAVAAVVAVMLLVWLAQRYGLIERATRYFDRTPR